MSYIDIDYFRFYFTHLKYNSGFLKQVCSHVSSNDLVTLIKTDFSVFSKSTAVIIPCGFCIAHSLQKLQTFTICFIHISHKNNFVKTWVNHKFLKSKVFRDQSLIKHWTVLLIFWQASNQIVKCYINWKLDKVYFSSIRVQVIKPINLFNIVTSSSN